MESAPILVVDDDPDAARYMVLALSERFPSVLSAPGGAQGFEIMKSRRPGVVVSDLRMPELDGIELLALTREHFPETAFLLVTVENDVLTAVDALKRGAFDYLVKPVPPVRLVDCVLRALRQQGSDLAASDRMAPEILGRSAVMARVRRQILEAARCGLNVLITGETGTGKELAARAIHRASARAAGPFVAHNCAATPGDLFESTFFGHEKGSFTGAGWEQRGLLEEADGGILLLDEMECLTPAHQGKLLRVMDDGMVRPVGARVPKAVSVRYLAATNREAAGMLADGSLRADLFYRMRGMEVTLPPLRERREDIPLLVEHFLRGSGVRLEAGALDRLVDHSWPGNVRELKNFLAASLAHCGTGVLRERDFVFGARTGPGGSGRSGRGSDATTTDAGASLSLREAEREMILQALKTAHGNHTQSARMLGIHRATLRRKLREFGIPLRPE